MPASESLALRQAVNAAVGATNGPIDPGKLGSVEALEHYFQVMAWRYWRFWLTQHYDDVVFTVSVALVFKYTLVVRDCVELIERFLRKLIGDPPNG